MRDKKKEGAWGWLCTAILFLLTLIIVKLEMEKGHEVLLYSDFCHTFLLGSGRIYGPAL